MSVKGKKHLSMMFALCKTIAESAEHLNEYSEDHFLKQDTVTGLNTLEASLESFKAYSAIQATRLFRSCVENDLYLYSGDFASIVSHWHTFIPPISTVIPAVRMVLPLFPVCGCSVPAV